MLTYADPRSYIYRKRRPEGPVFAGFVKITILILYPSL